MKSKLKAFALIFAISALSAGCGGGSDSSDSGFTNNISGVWTGTLTSTGGGALGIVATFVQAVSGSVRNAQGFSGTLSDGSAILNLAGTKDGNAINFSATAPTGVLTFVGNLSSATTMNGTYTNTSGSSGTWNLNL